MTVDIVAALRRLRMKAAIVIACYIQQANAQHSYQIGEIVGTEVATGYHQVDVANPPLGIEVLVELALLVIRDEQDLHRAGGPPVMRQIARRA